MAYAAVHVFLAVHLKEILIARYDNVIRKVRGPAIITLSSNQGKANSNLLKCDVGVCMKRQRLALRNNSSILVKIRKIAPPYEQIISI